MAWCSKEKWQLTKGFFVTKNLTFCIFKQVCLCCKFHCVLTKNHFPFLVNCQIILLIDQKSVLLMLTDGISDRKFPTFNIPIYPYKTYIFYCSETFLSGTCRKMYPIMYKVLIFPITKVHNVSHGPVWKFIFIWSISMSAVWIHQIFVHI